MSDPITVATASGIASGLATYWSMEASAWIKSYFVDHHPTAIKKAQQNTSDFLIELSNRVTHLENKELDPRVVLEDPEFANIFQKAVLTSAQTDHKDKHKLLANLLSERLKCNSESNFTVGSKMAVNILEYLTSHHLQVLAFICELRNVMYAEFSSYEELKSTLDIKLAPYLNLKISSYDLLQLEALSCVKYEFMYKNNLSGLLSKKSKYYSDEYLNTVIGNRINSIWDSRLDGMNLTISGLILGWNVRADRFSEDPCSESLIG